MSKTAYAVFAALLFAANAYAANTLQVKITVMANGAPVPGREVWLNYSDGQSIAGTTLKAVTDAQGKAVFRIPTVVYPQDTVFLSVPSLNARVRGRPFLVRDYDGDGIVSLTIMPMTWAVSP